MADIDLGLKFNDSLNSMLTKANANSDKFVDKMNMSNKFVTSMSKATGVASAGFKKMGRTLTEILPAASALFGGSLVIDTARDFFQLEQNILGTSLRLGESKQQSFELRKEIGKVAVQTGIATESLTELYKGFIEMRVPAEIINKIGENVANFSYATGMGVDATAKLVGELSRSAKVGTKGLNDILLSTAKVQKALGLTTNEIQSISSQIPEIAKK